MKFVSFNINGLRARIHQLRAIIDILQPEVIGLQETKVHDDVFPFKNGFYSDYYVYYYGQKSHYGVALFSKNKPLLIRYGLNKDNNNTQRRVIMADLTTSKGTLTVINCYFPQGENRNHPTKFLDKKRFYSDLKNYVKQNFCNKSLLIIMGDMNVSPTKLDIGIGKKNYRRWLLDGKCSFLPEERVWMDCLFALGLIDTYRHINPYVSNCYSWFDYRSRGFNNNRGLRIDFILASKILMANIVSAGIDYSIRAMDKPSDHAPIWAEFNL